MNTFDTGLLAKLQSELFAIEHKAQLARKKYELETKIIKWTLPIGTVIWILLVNKIVNWLS